MRNKEFDKIEKIYGEDVVDFIYALVKYNERDPESFLFWSYNDEILQIYFGDQDVKNSFNIFSSHPKNVRVISSENKFEIRDLFELIKIYF